MLECLPGLEKLELVDLQLDGNDGKLEVVDLKLDGNYGKLELVDLKLDENDGKLERVDLKFDGNKGDALKTKWEISLTWNSDIHKPVE